MRQYLLVGVPQSAFVLINAIMSSIAIMFTTAAMCGFLSLTVLDYEGIFVVMLVASIAIPIHHAYYFYCWSRSPAVAVIGMTKGLAALALFLGAATICFMAFGGVWLPAIILEILFSFNPFFAAAMVWIKYKQVKW